MQLISVEGIYSFLILKKCLPLKTVLKILSKLSKFFYYWPKTSQNLNFGDVKIAHRATYV